MIGPKASAKDGSTAVGGNNTGLIANINAEAGATVAVHVDAELSRRLPSHLGAFIAILARDDGLALPAQSFQWRPEVIDKLKHNKLTDRHPIITAWTRHSLALERAYLGVEQQNAAARYLVRQRAGTVYQQKLIGEAKAKGVAQADLGEFAIENAVALVDAVVDRLFIDYLSSKHATVEDETARLAVLLVVADAIVECEVLEKPEHAAAS